MISNELAKPLVVAYLFLESEVCVDNFNNLMDVQHTVRCTLKK